MVFLIQNTQNRDTQALHLKIDELIRVSVDARNSMMNLEDARKGRSRRSRPKSRAIATTPHWPGRRRRVNWPRNLACSARHLTPERRYACRSRPVVTNDLHSKRTALIARHRPLSDPVEYQPHGKSLRPARTAR